MSKISKSNSKVLFLDNISEKLIRRRVSSAPHEFLSVSFQLPTTGEWASVCANYATPSTRKDNSLIVGFQNVLLGRPESSKSIRIKGLDGSYRTERYTNQEIWQMLQDSRSAYKAATA